MKQRRLKEKNQVLKCPMCDTINTAPDVKYCSRCSLLFDSKLTKILADEELVKFLIETMFEPDVVLNVAERLKEMLLANPKLLVILLSSNSLLTAYFNRIVDLATEVAEKSYDCSSEVKLSNKQRLLRGTQSLNEKQATALVQFFERIQELQIGPRE